MDSEHEWKQKRFCIFAISFSDAEVPVVRRAIEDKTK
jgi:hypothetical protein